MKSSLATSLGLLGLATALALPAPEVDPIVRTLPPNWSWNITSLRGPDCSDLGNPVANRFNTRLTYGENTMDGSEIYYWHVAYPDLRASLTDTDHSWCETELSYVEYMSLDEGEQADNYRLRLHKNGTKVLATYDLDAGVTARWEITYDTGRGDEITDEITVAGPHRSGQYAQTDYTPASKHFETYKLPKCGAGTIKFRTDLYVEGKQKNKGVVDSEHSTTADGGERYGTQVGWSYDWEKCITSDV
ncbi:Nn.00g041390.m01.CDS01 [Neocucurbitaria sp. VM-36]